MSLFQALILCIFVSLVAADPWKKCINDKTSGTISKLSVKGCEPHSKVCDLKRGTNASVSVTFTAGSADMQATAKVFGVISHIPVPFPVANADACQYKPSGLNCPLEPNKEYEYNHLVEVKSLYPKVSLMVQWELMGNTTQIFCFVLNAQIVD